LHKEKINLSVLLKKVASGKEVIIARGKEPVTQLVPIGKARTKRVLGTMAGQISYSADAFAPLNDKEIDRLGLRAASADQSLDRYGMNRSLVVLRSAIILPHSLLIPALSTAYIDQTGSIS
jgi:antitoxin (DNA-binding transcriptional repressor) of toxin-antitoxin stability system